MDQMDQDSIQVIGLLVAFILSLPGILPLISWLRRIYGDPAKTLLERPNLPWWGRGFLGQLLVFLTMNFWIGITVSILVSIGEVVFSYELSAKGARSLDYGVMGGCVALAISLYQRAAAITFPPYFNHMERKTLKKLDLSPQNRDAVIADFQRKLGKVFEEPLPVTAEGLNFHDPQGRFLGSVSWPQVVCLPMAFTNRYLTVVLDPQAAAALQPVAHKRRDHYRLYFSASNILAGGMKLQAVARHLWAESQGDGPISGETARRAIKNFD